MQRKTKLSKQLTAKAKCTTCQKWHVWKKSPTTVNGEKGIYYLLLDHIDKCFTLFDYQTFNKLVVEVLYKELKILVRNQ